jgi:drug/metabolite transporter (DMT)-like permease
MLFSKKVKSRKARSPNLTRVQADFALALAGLIWGFGFVAQKNALDHIGPFTFVAARFLISALFVLPFVLREKGFHKLHVAINPRNTKRLLILCGAFSLAVILQQYGMKIASVTHTAFLTSLYIVMVPFVSRIFHRQALSAPVLIASLLAVVGIWLLSGGQTDALSIDFSRGDGMVLLCTVCFAIQVVVMGRLAKRVQLPFVISLLQYLAVGLAALVMALLFENIHLPDLLQAWQPILFAGLASGGIAYTLQSVAMQHTPVADASIIMSSEALFGAIGGMWLLGEKITVIGIIGCCAIMLAIMLVELGPLLKWGRTQSAAR